MTTGEDLRRTVEDWSRHPDVESIRHQLTTDENRHYLAILCADLAVPLPDDLAQLVCELVDSDPLTDLILDTLIGAALDPDEAPGSGELPDIRQLAQLIMDRPDSPAFQRMLSHEILDLVDSDETETEAEAEIPADVVDRLLENASALAAHLPEPALANVLLTHALKASDYPTVSFALRECWKRAVDLPDEELHPISVLVADLIDVDIDAELAIHVGRTALRLEARYNPPGDVDLMAWLHVLIVEALTRTDPRAGIEHARAAMADNPALEQSPVGELWTLKLLNHLVTLATNDASYAEILPFANQLADHRHRWGDDPEVTGCAATALARAYLAGNDPRRAGPWVDVAAEHPLDLPDYPAEVAMLRVNVALQLGLTEELPRLLRESAPLVAAAESDDYRLTWSTAAQAIGLTNRDESLAAEIDETQMSIVANLDDAAGGYLREQVQEHFAFHARVLDLQEQVLNLRIDERSRELAAQLCRDVPSGQPQLFLGAHLLAGFVEFAIGTQDQARHHLDEMSREIRRQRQHPDGGFPIVVSEQMEKILRVYLVGGPSWLDRANGLRAIRDDNEAAGRTQLAYMMTRSVMFCLAAAGHFGAATHEGIRAMAFHTGRAVTTPDARERAALRDDFVALAGETFQAALRAGWQAVAADILEIVRAQPVPIARTSIPPSEMGLISLVMQVLGARPTRSPWDQTWTPQPETSHSPDMGDPGTDTGRDSSLLLTALPSIAMPWGPALQDQLADQGRPTRAHLVVPRHDPGT